MQNTFLERTIENWLTNASERSYQMPFCQLLLVQGFKICHISKHNSHEQGKDIIALDASGNPVGFQLKGGNITHSVWGKIKSEVEELIDLKIEHPSVDKNKQHESYLITNGFLEDTVRRAIDNLNNGKWKDNPLKVKTKGELVAEFCEAIGKFLPEDPIDYKNFLDLYFSDGKEFVDIEKFSKFSESVLKIDNDKLNKNERKRNIASAVLFTSYSVANFVNENNYVSEIYYLTVLCSYILLVAEKFNLEEKYWKESFDLVWNEILDAGSMLQEEVIDGGLLKATNSMWDGEIGSYRKQLAVGVLFAIKISQFLQDNQAWNNLKVADFLQKANKSLMIWGESPLISFIMLFWYVLITEPNTDQKKQILGHLLIMPLDEIIRCNGKKSQQGLLSPYYDVNSAIMSELGLLKEPIDESFIGRSFTIDSFINLFTKYGAREVLGKRWRNISYICKERFYPRELWQNFQWRSRGGKMMSEFPNQTQSWAELIRISNKFNRELIPEKIKENVFFISLFLTVYPHRINSDFIKFVDSSIRNKIAKAN